MFCSPCHSGPECRSQPIRAGQPPHAKERTIPRKGQPVLGTKPTWRSSSGSNVPSIRAACSIPVRCFRSCIVALNSAVCTSTRVKCGSPTCRASETGERSMAAFHAADAKQVSEVVTWAAAEEQPLEIGGGGSKRGVGRPLQVEHVLEVSALSGIGEYEAAELVLTAGAATPLAEIEAALDANHQMFACEPADWRTLLGTESSTQTLGGALSCNLAGPRRIRAGAARDHFLGFQSVNGRGEIYKAGGKVVKNVTGYDLCKLIAGAYGTLGVLTEVTIRVTPKPETARTLLLLGLDDETAVRAMAEGLNSSYEVSGAAHLPPTVARRSQVPAIARAGDAVTALRIEGPEPSTAYRG